MRTLAIGDIHGCANLLDRLLDAVQPAPGDTLVFLGDYVDRGPDSRGVIDHLIALKQSANCIFLGGNHELMMMRARLDPKREPAWLGYGGAQTLGSYGPAPGRSGALADVPDEHWKFLGSLVDFFATDSHVFIHATLDPAKPLHEQDEAVLFWNKLEEPIALPDGRTVVCGHTAQKSGDVLNLGGTLCIDTFAYGGGKLTCLHTEEGRVWQIDLLGGLTEGQVPPPQNP